MNDSFVNINEIYESRKIWVPMDCCLTIAVGGVYFVAYLYDKDDHDHHKDAVDNEQAKEELLNKIDEQDGED